MHKLLPGLPIGLNVEAKVAYVEMMLIYDLFTTQVRKGTVVNVAPKGSWARLVLREAGARQASRGRRGT